MTDQRKALDAEHFPTTVARDLCNMMVGEFVGQGAYRKVFAYELDRTCVIKIEESYGDFDNVLEHNAWDRVRQTELAKWFAPIVSISANGILLVQKRTKPVAVKDLPAQVPAFFTDLKASNWGRYKGRVVCHDYGRNLLVEVGMTKRMRKANWS